MAEVLRDNHSKTGVALLHPPLAGDKVFLTHKKRIINGVDEATQKQAVLVVWHLSLATANVVLLYRAPGLRHALIAAAGGSASEGALVVLCNLAIATERFGFKKKRAAKPWSRAAR